MSIIGKTATLLLAALGAALFLAGCTQNLATTTDGGGGELRVREGDFRQRLVVTGELQAVNAIDILVPRTPTWQLAIRWLAQDGIEVEKGQKVVELDNSQFVSDLDQKRLTESKTINELTQKRADVAVDRSDREYAVEEATRALAKARLEAAVPEELRSRREYQEKQLELKRAEVALTKAEEALDSYRESSAAEITVLQIELEKVRREIRIAEQAIEALTVEAPSDGILVVGQNWREGRKLQVGDTAWVGMSVARIPDLSEMEVVARLSDVDDGKVTPGMQARCTLDTYPDLEFTGEVVEISPIAQEHGRRSLRRAFRLNVRLDGSDPERMRPGMSVKVEIETPDHGPVLLAPRAGLDLTREPPVAHLSSGRTREVEIGACNPRECIVDSGLDKGDILVYRQPGGTP
jgi:multidrug resistance efflux pump